LSVQGTGGSPTAPGPENRVGDQDTGSPDRPVSSGLQVPGEPGHCRARTRHLGDLPAAFVLQNTLQLHQQRSVISRVDSLALWKIINEEDAVLIPKNQGENFSSGFLHSMVHVPLMFLSEWREFSSALCLAENKKLDDSSRLDVVEIARVA